MKITYYKYNTFQKITLFSLIIFIILLLILILQRKEEKILNEYHNEIVQINKYNLEPAGNKFKFLYQFKHKVILPNYKSYIFIYSAFSNYKVFSDGEIIFEKNNSTNSFFKKGYKNVKIIKLDDKYIGKAVFLEFNPLIANEFINTKPTIYIAPKNVLISSIFRKDAFKLFMTGLFLIVFLELLILGIVFNKFNEKTYKPYHLSIFAFFASMYILSKCYVIYTYIDNPFLFNFLDYLINSGASIPIVLILLSTLSENNILTWQNLFLKVLISILHINLLVNLILVFFLHYEFVDFKILGLCFTQASLILCLIIPLPLNKKYTSVKNEIYITFFPLLLVFLLSDYLHKNNLHFTLFLIISITLFMIANIFLIVKKYIEHEKNIIIAFLNKQLALKDNLTGLYNRNALDKYLKKLKWQEHIGKEIFLILIDLNYLKIINDNLGHYNGDIYIKKLAEIINKCENVFEKIISYRYGGDEFLLISLNMSDSDKRKLISLLEKNNNKKLEEFPNYTFSFALGYDSEKISPSFDFYELLKKADKIMYKNKEKMRRN